MTSNEAPVRPKNARVMRRAAVLAAMIQGHSLAEIAQAFNITLKAVEKIVRDEMLKRWLVPAKIYGRLQIARLEEIAAQLKIKAGAGDLPAVDRLLKVMDRLDRYHGFVKLAAAARAPQENVLPQLTKKIGNRAKPQEPQP